MPLLRQLLEYKSVIDIVDKNQVHISNVDNEQILLAQDVNELLFAVHSDEFQQHQSHPRLAMKRFKYIYNVFEAAEREKEIVWEGRINAEGETIFLHAIKQGLLLLAFSLVAFGVDVDSARQDGTTSLILSAKKGWLEIVRWLVEMDCNVEAVGGVSSFLRCHNSY